MGVPATWRSKQGCHLTSKLSCLWWLPSLSQGGDLDAYIKLHEVRMPAVFLKYCILLRSTVAGRACCMPAPSCTRRTAVPACSVALRCTQVLLYCACNALWGSCFRHSQGLFTPVLSCSATPADPAREGGQDDCGTDPVWPGLPQHQASQVGALCWISGAHACFVCSSKGTDPLVWPGLPQHQAPQVGFGQLLCVMQPP